MTRSSRERGPLPLSCQVLPGQAGAGRERADEASSDHLLPVLRPDLSSGAESGQHLGTDDGTRRRARRK